MMYHCCQVRRSSMRGILSTVYHTTVYIVVLASITCCHPLIGRLYASGKTCALMSDTEHQIFTVWRHLLVLLSLGFSATLELECRQQRCIIAGVGSPHCSCHLTLEKIRFLSQSLQLTQDRFIYLSLMLGDSCCHLSHAQAIKLSLLMQQTD